MTDWQFINLVKEMRLHQRRYAESRQQPDLLKARELGERVDLAIEEYESRGQSLYDYEG